MKIISQKAKSAKRPTPIVEVRQHRGGEKRLATFIATAIKSHHLCEQHAHSAIESAIDCGEALIEAKKIVGHNNWQRWVAENVKVFGLRQAQTYMLVATQKHQALDLMKSHPDTVLSLRGVLAKLAPPKARQPQTQTTAATMTGSHNTTRNVEADVIQTVTSERADALSELREIKNRLMDFWDGESQTSMQDAAAFDGGELALMLTSIAMLATQLFTRHGKMPTQFGYSTPAAMVTH